ncbi:MAG TPA: DUF3662 and FHA domain-containing protein [Ktedonobacteraceae bacterium]|nr:DUF3662 and FHA domain-containing protein [Ktedonobacteraceae bacterium]
MKARQNPLTKFEDLLQRMVEGPFAWLFPSRLEPVELMRKLERAMEDNTLLQGEGRRLAPNTFDIFLSIKDHQELSAGQSMFIRDWQNNLIDFAKHRRYTLRTKPLIRLHAGSNLRSGAVRIEASMGGDGQEGGDGGEMHTQQLSPDQLAQLREQLASGPQLPGIAGSSSPNYEGVPATVQPSRSSPNNMSQSQVNVQVPPARLTIRLPQGGQQVYRIEKASINIGRQLSNDIIVEDKRVSRYHAQIKYQPDGQFAIYDLGSTNGITINGTPQMRQHTMRNGDRFTIGSYDFYFERL